MVLATMSLAVFVFGAFPGAILWSTAHGNTTVFAWFLSLNRTKERVYTLINPTNNCPLVCALQSQIAVGSGKTLGRGLGSGVQSELRFLPERQTDFFFASFSENLGFVGNLIVFTLYGALFYTLDQMIRKTRGKEGKIYSFAILAMLCTQFTINVGMNIGILPITGITSASYGGSSVLAICLALGLSVSAAREGASRHQIEIRSFL
jgi:rod shape determining protein RodA